MKHRADYKRNMRILDEAMTVTYKCHCTADKELERTQEEVRKRKLEFFKVFKTTHPDKTRDKTTEKKIEQFRKAMKEFRAAKLATPRYVRCEECEVRRQMNEKFLENMKRIIDQVQEPLDPNDFIASIHYKKYYTKVLQNDMNKHKDGNLSMFEDIRALQDL